jgi:mRNA-degrading endonuclease RelE of RelBE toxin-antitoxin system
MTFHVDWTARAENELADVWMNSPDPDAVAAAARDVERRLSRNPLGIGESRELGNRIVFETPLAVIYWVDTTNRIVTVVSVHWSGPRR